MTQRAFLNSLVVHTIVLTALIISFNAVRHPVLQSWPEANIVKAFTVDREVIEKELQRIRALGLSREQEPDKQAVAVKNERVEVEKTIREIAGARGNIENESHNIGDSSLKIGEEQARLDTEKKNKAAKDKLPADFKLRQQQQDKIIWENTIENLPDGYRQFK